MLVPWQTITESGGNLGSEGIEILLIIKALLLDEVVEEVPKARFVKLALHIVFEFTVEVVVELLPDLWINIEMLEIMQIDQTVVCFKDQALHLLLDHVLLVVTHLKIQPHPHHRKIWKVVVEERFFIESWLHDV